MSTARRPAAVLAVLAALLVTLLMSGCAAEAGVEQVTLKTGSTSLVLPAALSCINPNGATDLTCAGGDNDSTAPHLALSPGTPVTIDVPQKVGDTPWVVVFSYTDAEGKTQGDRTPVFAPKKQYSYTLTPPKGAQLTRLEVQSLTAAPSSDGGIDFPAVGTWVAIIDPVGGV